jgi:transposase
LGEVERALRDARRTVRQRVRAASPTVPAVGPVPTVAPATQAAVQAARLCRLRGIAPISGEILAQELFVRGLRNRREVGALSGLVPARAQSGETSRDLGVTRCGPRYLRAIAVEVAWSWLQWQPDSALAQWYATRYAQGGPRLRKIGIVALARKLLIALWHYLTTGTPPAGAIVRAAT